jgi:hypothetical protein
MHAYQQLSDQTLLDRLDTVAARDRRTTAEMIGLIGEIEKRRLYAGCGAYSMFQYCVRKLGFSEDMASKRITVARLARRFPQIVPALADGRLHLSGVAMLRMFLTQATAADLLAAAEGKTRRQIEVLIAERFPRNDLPAKIVELGGSNASCATTPQVVDCLSAPGRKLVQTLSGAPSLELTEGMELATPSSASSRPAPPSTASTTSSSPEPARVESRGRVTPLAPKRHAMQVTLGQRAIDMLDQIKALLSHQVPSGDLEQVLERTFEAAIVELDRRKHAATRRPRRPRQPAAGSRRIPAHVMRVVAARDGGRCAFVSPTGVRCEARTFIEYDHIVPVALGGRSSADNVRQLCRAHNQYEADRALGRRFMDAKREKSCIASA